MNHFGYAGNILRVDLSSGTVDTLETSGYAERFLGGRGLAAKLYWDETEPGVRAYDPANALICITGPVAGFTRFAGCRWQICGKTASMKPEMFSYANLGGSWGAWLKYAGYDGIVIKGKSETPVFIHISDTGIVIKDALQLWGKTVRHTSQLLHEEYGGQSRIMAIGPAGENLVSFATVQAEDSASGSSGFGAVMGSKNLKAVVVTTNKARKIPAADPEGLDRLAKDVYKLRSANFEDYEHILPLSIQRKACYGCIMGCSRGYYTDENGWEYKSQCQASGVYIGAAARYYGGMNDDAVNIGRLGSRLCDDYGLDTVVVAPMIEWLGKCFRDGILSDAETGLPLSEIGSERFIREFTDAVSFRKGFGNILADGTIHAAEQSGIQPDSPLYPYDLTSGNEGMDYDPRYIPANAMIYATEPRRAIQLLHSVSMPLSRWNNWLQKWENAGLSSDVFYDIADKYWGGRSAGNMTMLSDKATASIYIQDYGYIRESMIICDLAWPIWQVRDIDDAIRVYTMESWIIRAITGRDIDEKELMKIGERNLNMQRSVMIRDGRDGKQDDTISDYLFTEPFRFIFFSPECLVPGVAGDPVSMKGKVVDRNEFDLVRDDYYRLRGWDVETGLQSETRLHELDMKDVAGELSAAGLIRK